MSCLCRRLIAPGKKKWPVILYLHGAGERGRDGVLQTTVGLGPYVRERAATFPFFVVFPQAEDTQGRILTEWSPTSPDGKRALAILASVEREFAIDANRRVLSGWSMGGYGTWSIGAAEPKRWSALVPVAGGGDLAWASSLKDLPIWDFQGATDTVVPPSAVRPLIDAIRKAGGHPKYNEIPDVGHDVWKVAYGGQSSLRVDAFSLDPPNRRRRRSPVRPALRRRCKPEHADRPLCRRKRGRSFRPSPFLTRYTCGWERRDSRLWLIRLPG